MLGAISGDTIGSIYEFHNIKTKEFDLPNPLMEPTDDSILTIAVADWLLNDAEHSAEGVAAKLHEYGRRYPNPVGGYGGGFLNWLATDHPQPYGSWGNGAAMRVSAVGFYFDTLDETLEAARVTASVTHNHPEGIKGAQSTAAAVFLARSGHSKEEIKTYIEEHFGYDLSQTPDQIRPHYAFDPSCQGTVPQALSAFLHSTDFEDAVRTAVSIGGDTDTLCCITGGIAEAYYGEVPTHIRQFVLSKLPDPLASVVDSFYARCGRR